MAQRTRKIYSLLPIELVSGALRAPDAKIVPDWSGTIEGDDIPEGVALWDGGYKGFGPYTHLAKLGYGEEKKSFLAHVESPSAETSWNPVVFVMNTIATVLHHGHFLSAEEAERIPSIRALQLAWEAKGARHNDGLPRDQKWASGMEGWRWSGSLSHSTGTGRMDIQVHPGYGGWSASGGGEIVLTFNAGGETPGLCAQVEFSNGKWEFRDAVPELLEGRPDRVDLLYRLDRRLNGAILTDLRYEVDIFERVNRSKYDLALPLVQAIEACHEAEREYRLRQRGE